MIQEEKTASKRRKTLERELEWVRMAPKARQAKGKARLNYNVWCGRTWVLGLDDEQRGLR